MLIVASPGSVPLLSRTVPTARQPFFATSTAIACASPRHAPTSSIVLRHLGEELGPVSSIMSTNVGAQLECARRGECKHIFASDAPNRARSRLWRPMPAIDLNLITALDVLLMERSVTAAASRLGLSASAMSRTLTRLRSATGDPLLVRAGRSLVPTPYAEQLTEHVHALARDARAVLTPTTEQLDLAALDRTFTIRANESFVALLAAAIFAELRRDAPPIQLRFVPKPDKDPAPLRDGKIDLEIGTTGASAPEMRSVLLARDRFVGAVRRGHPLLDEPVTPQRYAACEHVVTSRRGASKGPVDQALQALGLKRKTVVTVPGFLEALTIARQSDFVALVPQTCVRGDQVVAEGLQVFELPVPTPELAIYAMWHPRFDADPAHRWFRQRLAKVCQEHT